MIQLARTRMLRSGRLHALHQFLDRRAFAYELQLVGIRHAEVDSIVGLQLMSKRFFAVHERAVAAAHILQHKRAIHGEDLRLLAADAAVAQREFVAGLPSDTEWRVADADFA